MPKEMYGDEAPGSNGHATYVDPVSGMESKAGVINEAGEIYGNIETAKEYGYVHRGWAGNSEKLELC
jgi:amino acid transporter